MLGLDVGGALPLGRKRSALGGEGRFELEELNFLGLGTQLGIGYKSGIDRDSKSIFYHDRQLGSSWWNLSANYSDNSDGRLAELSLTRPFYSLDTRWSLGGVMLDQQRVDKMYDLGREIDEFRHDLKLLSREQLRRSVLYLGTFSAIHVAAIVAAAMLPLETWKSARFYDGIVYHARMPEILRELKPYGEEFAFATDGYSMSAVASFHARAHVAVFGPASSHARHDDILTDFRRLDGKNILVLRKDAPGDTDYRPYFRSVEYRELAVSGATFHVVLGRGFDFAEYRERVLKPVRERFYAIPRYLPQGRCYFCERYFGAPICPAKD